MQHILCLGTHDIRASRYGGQRSVSGSLHAIADAGARLSYVIPAPKDFDERLSEHLHIYGIGDALSDGVRTLWRALRSGLPYKFAKYNTPRFVPAVVRLLGHHQFSAVFVHGAHMGVSGLAIKRHLKIPAILREHNIEYQIIDEYVACVTPLLRSLARWQGRVTRRAEHHLWRHYDRVLFISDGDMHVAHSQSALLGRSNVLSHSRRVYDGVSRERVPDHASAGARFVISGGLNVAQNRIGLKWFMRDIWPEVCKRYPEVCLDVIGIDKHAFLSGLGLSDQTIKRCRIKVLGEVTSFQATVASRPYFIAPTVVGSGYRVKIAEAGAAGSCVFLTPKDENSVNFLKHAHNCLCFSDVPSFCSAYNLVAHNNKQRLALRQNLQQSLQTHMSWSGHAQAVLEAVQSSVAL